ncbi:hypothetical protein CYLTODRAFT_439474 [Cylindrobasidium torrendii FP15055 ss-10]|uniref:Uncharacterized protein n=1 Tax=Cylindrobasidium torrendii FP15055 ss-10 TaxID=1314674 RepID=A0A0D7BVK8_9AGAR|nr:hypothetical protein CYLTODRAFT_439474 [Cylindrobasidium torrendii FP15055 ss-10]
MLVFAGFPCGARLACWMGTREAAKRPDCPSAFKHTEPVISSGNGYKIAAKLDPTAATRIKTNKCHMNISYTPSSESSSQLAHSMFVYISSKIEGQPVQREATLWVNPSDATTHWRSSKDYSDNEEEECLRHPPPGVPIRYMARVHRTTEEIVASENDEILEFSYGRHLDPESDDDPGQDKPWVSFIFEFDDKEVYKLHATAAKQSLSGRTRVKLEPGRDIILTPATRASSRRKPPSQDHSYGASSQSSKRRRLDSRTQATSSGGDLSLSGRPPSSSRPGENVDQNIVLTSPYHTHHVDTIASLGSPSTSQVHSLTNGLSGMVGHVPGGTQLPFIEPRSTTPDALSSSSLSDESISAASTVPRRPRCSVENSAPPPSPVRNELRPDVILSLNSAKVNEGSEQPAVTESFANRLSVVTPSSRSHEPLEAGPSTIPPSTPLTRSAIPQSLSLVEPECSHPVPADAPHKPSNDTSTAIQSKIRRLQEQLQLQLEIEALEREEERIAKKKAELLEKKERLRLEMESD